MKMAKASEADLNMAMELTSALDVLGQRFCPSMPEAIEQLAEDDEREQFDRYDDEQCGRAMRHLLELTDKASLMRVVFGCVVMLDPRNKCVDPAADTIEHHPDVVNNAKNAERYLKVRRGQRWSVINGVGDTLRDEALDAEVHAWALEPVIQHLPADDTEGGAA